MPPVDNAPGNKELLNPRPRRYSVGDVRDLVRLLESSGEYPESEIAGMQKLVTLLAHYEFLSEADIDAEVARHFAAKRTI